MKIEKREKRIENRTNNNSSPYSLSAPKHPLFSSPYSLSAPKHPLFSSPYSLSSPKHPLFSSPYSLSSPKRPLFSSPYSLSTNIGFTLIEIIIVVALLLAVGAIVGASFVNLQRQTVLNTTTEEIASRLREAQNKAISGSGDVGSGGRWGIYFNTDLTPSAYCTFRGSAPTDCKTAGSAKELSYFALDNALQFSSLKLGSTTACTSNCTGSITFSAVSGKADGSAGSTDCSTSGGIAKCEINIKLNSGTVTNHICVNNFGRVTIQLTNC